jgi:hypothetical protein
MRSRFEPVLQLPAAILEFVTRDEEFHPRDWAAPADLLASFRTKGNEGIAVRNRDFRGPLSSAASLLLFKIALCTRCLYGDQPPPLSCCQSVSGFGLARQDRQDRAMPEPDLTARVDRIGSQTAEKLKDNVVLSEMFRRRVIIIRHIAQ